MSLFKDSYYLEIMQLAELGTSLEQIAARWKVSVALLEEWIQDNEALRIAYVEGGKRAPSKYWRRRTKKLTRKQRVFLYYFRETYNIALACELAGTTRSLHYLAMDHSDPDNPDSYAAVFREIEENDLPDKIRGELYRRAVLGLDRYKFHNGRLCEIPCHPSDPGARKYVDKYNVTHWVKPYVEREYSDSLLGKLASARLPEFRMREKEIAEAGATKLNVDIAKLTEELESNRSNQITLDDIDNVVNKIATHNGATKKKVKKRVRK